MGRYPQQTTNFRFVEGVNVKKFSYMLEHPCIQVYFFYVEKSNNDFGATSPHEHGGESTDNQQATFVALRATTESPQRLYAEISWCHYDDIRYSLIFAATQS